MSSSRERWRKIAANSMTAVARGDERALSPLANPAAARTTSYHHHTFHIKKGGVEGGR